MSQSYTQFCIQDYNLGLNTEDKDVSKYGIASTIQNLQIKEGKVQNLASLMPLFSNFDNYSNLQSQFLEIGGVEKIVPFELYDGNNFLQYLVICSSLLKIYYMQVNTSLPQITQLADIQLTSSPIFETYITEEGNLLLISSVSDEMWIWDGINLPLEVLDAPKVTSMAVGMERLFVTCEDEPYKVLYSEDKDPSNWSVSASDAGEISFVDNLGAVIKVFSLDNYIYVIRQKAIIKIYSSSTASNFKQSKLFVSTGKIYPQSICLCGDKIVFLSTDGLYSFDGLTAKKLYSQIDNLFAKNNSNCKAVCLDNVYYLCANIIQNSMSVEAVIALNLNTNYVENIRLISGIKCCIALDCDNLRGVCYLCDDLSIKNAKNILVDAKNIEYCANNQEYFYLTNKLSLKPYALNKTFTKLRVLCSTDASITVFTENESKILKLKANTKEQVFVLGLSGKKLSFSISGVGELNLTDLQIDYSYIL